MILNVGLRTDIVNCYTDWLFRRFEEGFVYARNPLFSSRVNTYELVPEKVDGISFCSKNYAPALSRLGKVVSRFRTYFFYTITPYGKDLEPNIPPAEESVETLKALSRIVGKGRLAWRYDPVLTTPRYTPERHIEEFERLAAAISPYVSKCIFSFVEMFIMIDRRIPDILPLKTETKHFLAQNFAKIAKKYRLPLQICCAESGYEDYGIRREGCLTLETLGNANNCRFKLTKHTGNRAGCKCFVSRDIGWYDSCPNECLYCNANRGIEDVQTNVSLHDPASPLLIGHVKEDDVLLKGVQNSLLMHDGKQISLFDV